MSQDWTGRSLARAAAVFASTFVGLVAADVVAQAVGIRTSDLRVWERPGPRFPHGPQPRWGLYDPELLWALYPRFRGTYEPGQRVTINSLGHRDAEPGAPIDVMTAGDSFTFGVGLDDDEVIASVAERMSGLNVYNIGVSGYSTWQARRSIERALRNPQVRPRHVVYCWFQNDIDFNESSSRAWLNDLWRHSGRRISLAKALSLQSLRDGFSRESNYYGVTFGEVLNRVEDILRMQAAARSHGAEFCVLALPARTEVLCGDLAVGANAVLLTARARGVRVYHVPGLVMNDFFCDDPHYSASGAVKAAVALVAAVGGSLR